MKNKNFRSRYTVFLSLLLLALTSSPASAIDPGWYGGFAIGQSEISDTGELGNLCASVSVVCNEDETDTGWQGIVGYQVNNYVGFEGAFFDLGSPGVSVSSPVAASATADFSGLSISVVPQIPLGSVGGFFGRFGLAAGEVDLKGTIPSLGVTASESVSGGTLLYGLGGIINFTGNAAVRVEWTRYAIDETLKLANSTVTTPDIDFISGSLIFSFR